MPNNENLDCKLSIKSFKQRLKMKFFDQIQFAEEFKIKNGSAF